MATKLTQNRNVTYAGEARQLLKKGVDKVADAVKVTLGPNGKNVIIEEQYGLPHVTKDGVTVAKNINLSNPVENLGASLIKNAALKANEDSGDGTTTATVLTQTLVSKGFDLLETHPLARPINIKRGLEECAKSLEDALLTLSTPVDSKKGIEQVAGISSNGDSEIVGLVSEAYQTASSETVVTVEESSGTGSYVEFTKGFKVNSGLTSPYFITNQAKESCELEDSLVYICNGALKTYTDVLPVIERAIELNKPLLFIAKEISQEAQNVISLNVVKGGYNLCYIELQEHGDLKETLLSDIALMTGGVAYANVIHGDLASEELDSFFGQVGKIEVTPEGTTFVEGAGDPVQVTELVSELKTGLETCELAAKSELTSRIARLSGSVSVIKVGGRTEVEVQEKVDRVDDAINAVKAALKKGVVAGGGVALIHAARDQDYLEQNLGWDLLREACTSPFLQLCENCDIHNGVDLLKTLHDKPATVGYNFETQEFESFINQGIIDPVLVTINSLQAAVSVAGLLLTTEATLNYIREEK